MRTIQSELARVKAAPTVDSPVAYPIGGETVGREELQELLERCFENSRRNRQDAEYEEWLSAVAESQRLDGLERDAREQEESERDERVA